MSLLVRTDFRARAAYAEAAGIHRIVPTAVCRPASVEEVVEALAWARARGLAVTPRGAGSSMGGGSLGAGLVLDCSAVNAGPVRVDSATRLAVSPPGATPVQVNAAAARAGLRMPVDPSSARFASSAGLVSTNAAGARSFRVGSVRSWVQGLDLVTADGRTLSLARGIPADPAHPAVQRFERQVAPALRAARAVLGQRFPRTRKNSFGYALDHWLQGEDLIDLLVGSEGTLAVVTGVTWRLEPVPRERGGLRIAVTDDAELGKVLTELRRFQPAAIELLDRTFLRFVAGSLSEATRSLALRSGAMLLVEFEGHEAAVHEAVAASRSRLAPMAYEVAAGFGEAALEALWAIRHAASPLLAGLGAGRRSLQVIEDGCVPADRLVEYLAALRTIPTRHGIEAVIFGHAGDAHLHVNLLADTTAPGWEARVAVVFDEVSEVQRSLGGTPSGEHGAGRLRSGLAESFYGREVVALFQAVKRAFDPEGRLNPGVVIDGGPDSPLDRLKAGESAAELPADIADEFRRVERAGDWLFDRYALADRDRAAAPPAREVAPR